LVVLPLVVLALVVLPLVVLDLAVVDALPVVPPVVAAVADLVVDLRMVAPDTVADAELEATQDENWTFPPTTTPLVNAATLSVTTLPIEDVIWREMGRLMG